ncbi:hypothetical protein LFX25_20710 [Leptospira sp. FAT2]|uniref:hypothetical protein n=1 Tax=Leptospira sanjuanensis TaxID=2879643 RepID=UPI001EE98707|nr:hypothetical protein [Leptospira sanjuanensis]MCG6195668.1 hypothetical protein [Leptospira sanjuanensis]
MKEKCYKCDEIETSREHVPAKSFFPPDKRIDLITVPSCDLHNNAKSMDDEYVRNLLTINAGVNDTGYKLSESKVIASFKRSRFFLSTVFKNAKDIFYKGELTKSIKIDQERLTEYFIGVGYALYRHEFKKNFVGNWYVHTDFQSKDETTSSSLKSWELDNRIKLRSYNFPASSTKNPEIFQYSYIEKNNEIYFKLIYYENACVYLCTIS